MKKSASDLTKRMIDLLVSLTLLMLGSPILLFVAIVVRCKMGSPIIFKQQRPGRNGIPFYLYKFRTMAELRNEQGEILPDDKRLTTVGKRLRRYSLDELPQLFNVLKGDMSLIGPRPLLMEYLPLYTEEQYRRHEVKPGMTGWAQVNGRNAITWEEKFKLDTWYVGNRTLVLDFKILLMTFIKMVKKEGINQYGHVTMERFKGSNEAL